MVEAAAVANRKDYASSREQFEGMVAYFSAPERQSMSHSDLERELEIQGRELLRRLYQEHLELREMGEVREPVRGADSIERTQKRTHERRLMSIFGEVEVCRTGHGAKGVESLHPLDAELNLPEESYSLRVRQRVAEESSKNSYDETVESVSGTTGASIPKRQAEQLVERAAQDFDAFYDARKERAREGAETGQVLILSVDGKGVTMRPSDLREATRQKAEQRQHKLTTRLSEGSLTRGQRRGALGLEGAPGAPHGRRHRALFGGAALAHELRGGARPTAPPAQRRGAQGVGARLRSQRPHAVGSGRPARGAHGGPKAIGADPERPLETCRCWSLVVRATIFPLWTSKPPQLSSSTRTERFGR